MKLIGKFLALAGGVSAWYKPSDKVWADITVKVEFLENSYKSSDIYRQHFTSSENFHKEINQIDLSGSAGIEIAGIGGANSAFTFSKMSESQKYAKNDNQLTTQTKIEYQPGFTQVLRVIQTTILLNGESITETEKAYVGTNSGLSWKQRNDMAVDYINTNIKCSKCPNVSRNIIHYTRQYDACSEGDILFKGKCHDKLKIIVQGSGLWGYDGGFYPSPEPYLKIDADGRRVYTGSYTSDTASPSLYYSTAINKFKSSINVEMWDDDTEGAHDLMCRKYFDMNDVRSNLIKYGKQSSTSMSCYEEGSAKVTFYIE
jgi:hypothetical protein